MLIQPEIKAGGNRIPFAFTVARGGSIENVWPTLTAAVDAARKRSTTRGGHIAIHAWFEDGTNQQIPSESLLTVDQADYISEDEASRLEHRLFPRPTIREQITHILRREQAADYWEKLVLRYAEELMAIVDENLRGITVEETGLEKWTIHDFHNLPSGGPELLDGRVVPKHWTIAVEGLRRLGLDSTSERLLWQKSSQEIRAEYARRRAELRARPFTPSPVPFPRDNEE